MLPKEKLERLVIEQLRSKVLTDENLEELVTMVNEELQSASCELKDRMDVIDAELRDVKARLSRLYDALETGKLELDDLAPIDRSLLAHELLHGAASPFGGLPCGQRTHSTAKL